MSRNEVLRVGSGEGRKHRRLRNVMNDLKGRARIRQVKQVLQRQLFEPDPALAYFLDQYAAARNSGMQIEAPKAFELAADLTFKKFGWDLRRPDDGEGGR